MICPFRPKLQLKVVKPAELLQGSANSTVGNFTSVGAAGLFLAAFLAKLPLDLLDVTDVYGKSQFCSICFKLYLFVSGVPQLLYKCH